METVFARCGGIDVHGRTAVVCPSTPGEHTQPVAELRTYGTTTAALLQRSDWLSTNGCTDVGIESTGDDWKPLHNPLEGSFEVCPLNARHSKAVPGRKTDVKDAQWIAELLRHGLVRPGFIPPRHQRELRELTRHRTNFVQQRATLSNRVQKVLEGANIKLASVVSDVLGVSGRACSRPSAHEARRPGAGPRRARPAASPFPPGLIHHADRGVQYASAAYVARLAGVGARASMSARGNPYEYARAERFFKTLKREEVYLQE